MRYKLILNLIFFIPILSLAQDIVVIDKPIEVTSDFTVSARKKIQLANGTRVKPPKGIKVRFRIGDGGIIYPNIPKEIETIPIIIHETQNTTNAPGTQEFYATLIDSARYEAVRIGEYLWMNRNLKDSIPNVYAKPWDTGGGFVGLTCLGAMDMSQYFLDRDLDRLHLDKSQFQVNMQDFHTYYGRYYSRFETWHFQRKQGEPYVYEDNLRVFEGKDKVRTPWKLPSNADFRQLFAMCPVGANDVLGQTTVRITLSSEKNENPLAYDINDPNGGMNYRTSWFEQSTNALGFNMMPGGARLNGDGYIDNGLGPENGKWRGIKGDIYHLFHTAKYATSDSQVGIHDNLSTGIGMSYHWYNVRFCRELSDIELGYKLYINQEDYEESYDYTILGLDPEDVDIIKLPPYEVPPKDYYELPKGYLRGFYVQYILDKKNPKTVADIVRYLKKVDDDLFYAPTRSMIQPTALQENTQQSNPTVVYPNPVTSTLHVDTRSDSPIRSIEIFQLTGMNVLRLQNLKTQNTIDVRHLSPGVHFVVVETEEGRFQTRIIKQ